MQVIRMVDVEGGNVVLTHEDRDIKASMVVSGLYFSHTYKNKPVSSMTEEMAKDFYDGALKYLKGDCDEQVHT